MAEKTCSEELRKAVILVARKNGISTRQCVEVLAKYYDVDAELLSAAMALFEDDFEAKPDTRSEELAESEENKPKTPYLIFFVRTVPHHLIPWYTSGFQ